MPPPLARRRRGSASGTPRPSRAGRRRCPPSRSTAARRALEDVVEMRVAVQRLDRRAQRAERGVQVLDPVQEGGRGLAVECLLGRQLHQQRLGLGHAGEDRERAAEAAQPFVALAQGVAGGDRVDRLAGRLARSARRRSRARRARAARAAARRSARRPVRRRAARCPAIASSRRCQVAPGRTRAIVPATRATTGAGRRWMNTLSWSRRMTGSVTVRPLGLRHGDRAADLRPRSAPRPATPTRSVPPAAAASPTAAAPGTA